MLVLARKINESLVIDGRIVVRVVKVDGDTVKIGIEAAKDIPIFRSEIYEEIEKNNRNALTQEGSEAAELALKKAKESKPGRVSSKSPEVGSEKVSP